MSKVRTILGFFFVRYHSNRSRKFKSKLTEGKSVKMAILISPITVYNPINEARQHI